jgi:hypothetical protein
LTGLLPTFFTSLNKKTAPQNEAVRRVKIPLRTNLGRMIKHLAPAFYGSGYCVENFVP